MADEKKSIQHWTAFNIISKALAEANERLAEANERLAKCERTLTSSFITDCVIETRDGENIIFWQDVGYSVQMSGYAIIPRERYEELISHE